MLTIGATGLTQAKGEAMGDYVDDGQTRVRGFEEEERALIEMGGDR